MSDGYENLCLDYIQEALEEDVNICNKDTIACACFRYMRQQNLINNKG